MKKVFGLLVLLFPLLAIAQAQEVFVSKEPAKRKAVIEEYTGAGCGYCPDGHKAEAALLKKYPGQLFAINIHAGSLAVPVEKGDPDMRTPDGTALNSMFGISTYPAAVMNRHKFGTSYNMAVQKDREKDWENYMQQILAMDSYVNIAAKGELDWATRKLTLTVQLYYTGTVSGTTSNRIHVSMTQDEIIATQKDYGNYNPNQVTEDGRYRHLHVFRDMLTPLDGDIVTPVGKDSLITRTYEWTLPDTINAIPLDLLNTHFVVFVAESRYEILSACEPELKHNMPETVVSISNAESRPSYSCDLAGRAAFTLNNRLGKDISEVTFSIQTSWGNTEYTYKPDSVLKAEQSVNILTDAFAAKLNNETNAKIKVKTVNGKAYPADATSSATIDIFANYAFTHNADVTLNVVQDRFGSDITWNFRDTEKDTILYKGGPYHDLPSSGTKVNSVPMSLENGCYVLTVYDETKDGINNGRFGEGNINFVSQAQEFYRHNGIYADSVVIMLDTRENAANGKTEKIEMLTLRPNPAKDRAEISFTAEKTSMVRVQVLNHTGACVLDLGNIRTEAGNARIELPLQNLVPGMYFVVLRGENINLSSKLVVVR